MSYSKGLLFTKGALGTVWVAAVRGEAALSREQVACMDIVASVDKILSDVQTPHRILALLLLGIVRIYSKKVEYLYHDCNQLFRSFELRRSAEPSTSTGRSMHGVLKQVKKAVRAGRLGQQDTSKVKKPVHAARTGISGPISSEGLSLTVATEVIVRTSVVVREARAPDDLPTFTIPKRFELDSFDLEIDEDRDDEGVDHHQSACQDILLEDDHHHAPYLYESYQRAICSHADGGSACFMPEYIALPPEMISAISEVNNIPDLSNEGDGHERENQNDDSACFTPVKDVLPPEMEDTVAEVNDPSNKSKRGEKSRRELTREENGGSADSIPLPEIQEGQKPKNVLEDVTTPSLTANNPTIEESECFETAPPVGEFLEHDPVDHQLLEPPIVSCKTRTTDELSPSTPEPLPEGVPGPPLPRFTVRTPAKSENRVTRKRRRGLYNKEDYIPTDRENNRRVRRRATWLLCDEHVVLPNKMLRKAIEDASDLMHQRRKAPHTYLDAWKVAKISSLPDAFMDPIFPYSTWLHPGCNTTPDAPESSCRESVKTRRRLSYKFSESNHSCKDAEGTEQECILDGLRKRKLDELADIQAPGCYIESGHVQDDVCECIDDTAKEKGTQVKGDEHSSVDPLKTGMYESENHAPLHNETLNSALDYIDEDIFMDEEHTRDEVLLSSTRTRKIARCLHQLLLDQKCKQMNNSLSFSQALEGRKRKTSARFFYETLILKSRGLIEVNQELPYDDILVSATPQLEAEFQSSGN